MTTTTHNPTGLSTDHSRAAADGAHTHGKPAAPGSSRADRAASFAVADFPVPTGREEEWRFTPLDRLQGLLAGTVDGQVPSVQVDPAPGVSTQTLARGDERLGQAGVPSDRLAAQAWETATEALAVTIPRGQVIEGATTVTIRGNGGHAAQHLLIDAEPLSEAVVVLDHVGSGELNQTVEIRVGDGAHLRVVSLQDWESGAVHASSHRASIGRDASLKHVVVTLGGDVVRLTPEAAFAGPGGEVALDGLYFADAGQHQEHRLFVDHGEPNCSSRVTYKGALQGESAHIVWIGDVLIRKAAEGTDTYELNRNLVLTDGARADSVPNLEIETGEIEGAGHASATGRFDDEQLFYLTSRGIPEPAARRLVVRGFFAEMIAKIGVAAIEERLLRQIDAELDQVMGELVGGEVAEDLREVIDETTETTADAAERG